MLRRRAPLRATTTAEVLELDWRLAGAGTACVPAPQHQASCKGAKLSQRVAPSDRDGRGFSTCASALHRDLAPRLEQDARRGRHEETSSEQHPRSPIDQHADEPAGGPLHTRRMFGREHRRSRDQAQHDEQDPEGIALCDQVVVVICPIGVGRSPHLGCSCTFAACLWGRAECAAMAYGGWLAVRELLWGLMAVGVRCMRHSTPIVRVLWWRCPVVSRKHDLFGWQEVECAAKRYPSAFALAIVCRRKGGIFRAVK